MTTNNLTVTGIDLGSSSVKIAAILKGGVEIITNQANFRQTPNVVGFGQKQRFIGEAGQVKIKSNHSNTVTAPSRFLGFDQTCPYLQEQLKFCPAKPNKLGQKKLNFNLFYGTQKQQFTSEQLVAAYLTEIQKIIAQTNNLVNKNMVITVPSYFTQHQRVALLNAIEIAKKKTNNQYSTQFVDEQIAVSMDFGFPKRNQFSQDLQKGKNVLFIDFGHSKLNAFVTSFNKQHMRIKANKFNRQLGCKFMDQQLLKFYATLFDKAHPNTQLNLLQSKKAVLKLLQNIEKQRKVLSGNLQHDLSIECLLQDQDLSYSMKRQQYEKICEPLIYKFKAELKSFFDELRFKGIKFQIIQLIGGGSRIPVIINSIQQVFGIEPSRTINSNQCIARGAALISAMNSTVFKVHNYPYFSPYSYEIQLKVNGQAQQKRLIPKGELLVGQKTYELYIEDSTQKFILTAQYSKNLIQQGLQSKIFECEVSILKKAIKQQNANQNQMKQESEQNKKTKLNISLSFDSNGILNLNKISSPDNQTTVQVGKINTFSKFTSSQLLQMQEKQKQMTLKDLKVKKLYQKKNQFESFIYKSKHTVQKFISENQNYISEDKSKQLMNILEAEQSCLNASYQQKSDFNIEQINAKTQNINQNIDAFMNSVMQLKKSHSLVDAQIQKLANLINQIIQKRNEDMYPNQINQVGKWLNQIFSKQKSQPKFNNPVVSFQQVKEVYNNLLLKINQFDKQIERKRLLNSRKPKQQQYQQRQHPGSVFVPNQSSYNPYGGYASRPNYDDQFRPRTTRNNNRSGLYGNNNPFGSFFGNGLSGFF